MSKLNTLTVHETLDGLNKKEFSAVELAEEYIKDAEAARRLNAYVLETPEAALSKAAESDQRYASGNPRPLEGIPLGIKRPVLYRRYSDDRLFAYSGRFYSALRINGNCPFV